MHAVIPSLNGLKERLGEACRTAPVSAAYLFGSAARGSMDAESDIDVAILADGSPTPEMRRRLQLDLMRSFGKAIGVPMDRLDVVVLQDVPALLQYNVIRAGAPVYERSPGVRMDFEINVERRYDDESPLLDREADLTIDRILSRAS